MFLDEAKLSARLNHPNIVQTYEVDHDDAGYFTVMEYLEGQPLSAIMRAVAEGSRARRASRGVWVRIVADLLSGLHYAHELRDYDGAPLGIVHRDVSPHNIFVTYDGAVKLLDFGIAKASINTDLTETGKLKGKTSYMAPEQAVGSGLIPTPINDSSRGAALRITAAYGRQQLSFSRCSPSTFVLAIYSRRSSPFHTS